MYAISVSVGKQELFPSVRRRYSEFHQLRVVVIQGIACHSFAVVSSEYPVTLLGVLAEAAQPVKVLAPSHFNHPALPYLAGFS